MTDHNSNHFTGDPIVQKYLAEQVSENPNSAQIKALQNFVKKHLGSTFTGAVSWKKSRVGIYGTVAMPSDKGLHGRLVKDYSLYIEGWNLEDEKNGAHMGLRVDLQWQYKAGGSNGSGVGTIFVAEDGKVIGER